MGLPPTSRKARLLRAAMLGTLVAALLLLATAWWIAGRLLAPAPASDITLPPGLDATALVLEDARGRTVHGWYIPPATRLDTGTNAGEAAPRGVVVLLHGIRGNRTAMLPRARFLSRAGYGAVLIDLHAHGESDGDRITLGYEERLSVEAAVGFAKERLQPARPVAVLGVSLGGAAAALASPLGIDALVLESVYPDIESAIQHRVGARLGAPLGALPAWLLLAQIQPRLSLSRSDLRPIDRLAGADCPLLVISGAVDPHTPAEEAKRLFSKAAEPKEFWLVPDAGHVDLYAKAQAEYEGRILRFLGATLASD